jgi:uncharacterized membrane protein (DUF485 family)
MLSEEIVVSLLTIFGAVLVLVFGQIFIHFVVKPVNKLRMLLGKIKYNLIFYANRYTNLNILTEQQKDEVRTVFRSNAAQLSEFQNSIVLHSVWSWFGLIPNSGKIQDSITDLIFLSNSLEDSSLNRQNQETRSRLEERLFLRKRKDISLEKIAFAVGILSVGLSYILFALDNEFLGTPIEGTPVPWTAFLMGVLMMGLSTILVIKWQRD